MITPRIMKKEVIKSIKDQKKMIIDVSKNYYSFCYFFSKKTVKNYVLCHSKINKSKLEIILKKISIPNDAMIMKSLYGGLGKKMTLNIHIAMSKKDFIVLDLDGLSPMQEYTNIIELIDLNSEYNKSALIIKTLDDATEILNIQLNYQKLKEIYNIDVEMQIKKRE
ncbi:MAG: hypothetical protein MUC49_14500 [Raineya sp.]|nr:hypothetical protein [Raineya sp.]